MSHGAPVVLTPAAPDFTRCSKSRKQGYRHAQLGNQPWLKLAAAMAATFVVTRGIRRLPLGAVATTALPLVAAAMNRKFAR